jgi:NAD(P)-dependent dehydrogenase (short-subunit alcohol dehydrogenase family)
VAILDLDAERGEALAAEIGGAFERADVTDDASVETAFEGARAAHGQERMLVNCAGIAEAIKTASRDRETGAIRAHPADRFARVIAVNLVGTFRCIARSAAGMMTLEPLEGCRGAVVNTASVAAEDGQVGQAAYAASKGGVVGMTLPVARDLAAEGIRVNTILPGLFDTPLLASLPEPVRRSLGESVLNPRRLGRPEEYAALAVAMIENDYFNGEDVRLDGGIRMAPR